MEKNCNFIDCFDVFKEQQWNLNEKMERKNEQNYVNKQAPFCHPQGYLTEQ